MRSTVKNYCITTTYKKFWGVSFLDAVLAATKIHPVPPLIEQNKAGFLLAQNKP